MIEYLYDGSFEGLLTTIFYAYTIKEDVKITKSSDYIPSLLTQVVTIETEDDKYRRVYSSIKKKLSPYTLNRVYHLYLCTVENIEDLILNYIKLCFKFGDKINQAKHNDIIIRVDKYYRQVSLEAHRFTGFVRFKEIGPLSFYSTIEPDHNILPLLIQHFTSRFSDQNFIIHDIKREYAILYNKKEVILTYLSKETANFIIDKCCDDNFEDLWKEFYTSTNIKERENLKNQRRSMPIRYWKHLTETQ